jgi:low affinity Fe/Cu permease
VRSVWMADHPIRHWLTTLGVWTAAPLAFLIVPVYGALWFTFDRADFNWHAIAVLATWFMTLLIQRAEHRDTQAIHAKLDELLHVQSTARNELTNIDKKDPEEIEKHRKVARAND